MHDLLSTLGLVYAVRVSLDGGGSSEHYMYVCLSSIGASAQLTAVPQAAITIPAHSQPTTNFTPVFINISQHTPSVSYMRRVA